MAKNTCYLCMPSYGSISAGAARGFFRASRGKGIDLRLQYDQGSLLATNFNAHWCTALNAALEGKQVDYFAMLHADVQPQDYWLDILIAELERCNLDMLSAIVPIKDCHGLTSTAIGHEDSDSWHIAARITMNEAYRLPQTFTAAEIGFPDRPLLVNTGCWVCKFDPEWAAKVHFEINDRIVFDENKNRYVAEVEPEDWNMSRQMYAIGLKVGATRKVMIAHQGAANYVNAKAWGDFACDRENVKESILPLADVTMPSENWKFPDDVEGWLTETEGRELAKLATGKRVLEIGSYCGKSTICMAQTAASVTAVDPFDGRGTPTPRSTFDEFMANTTRYSVNGYALVGTMDEAGPTLEPGFDFVFIDGAHDAANVRNDIEWTFKLLNPNGFIAFHDYQNLGDEGVTEAVDELLAGRGVLLATYDSLAVVKPTF